MQKIAIEGYKAFPYIAWMTVVGFAFFVYTITVDLQETAASLERTTANLELQVNQPAGSKTPIPEE